jgi:peptide chain release factor subunit 1
MFERKDLESLERFNSGESFVLSIFLNVSPQERKRGGYLLKFKNLLKAISEEKLLNIKDDIKKIEKFLQTERESFKKFLILYSCTKNGLWQRYNLNIEIKEQLVIDKTPYTSPLFDLLDNYQKYGVLLVDKRSARVFLVFLGDIEEYGMIEHDHVPGKHKKGGWFALAEKRYERHIEHHIKMHLKDVIDKFGDFLNDKEIRRIIVAGPEEAVYELMETLPESIKQKIVGRTFIKKHASAEEVLEKVMPLIHEYEYMKESKTLADLVTRARKNVNAILGIDDVLMYLREKRVMKLVIPKDYKIEGNICSSCGFATQQKVDCCMECGDCVMKTHNLIEKATEMALQSGVLIEVIKDEKERNILIENGGIGAFLRF